MDAVPPCCGDVLEERQLSSRAQEPAQKNANGARLIIVCSVLSEKDRALCKHTDHTPRQQRLQTSSWLWKPTERMRSLRVRVFVIRMASHCKDDTHKSEKCTATLWLKSEKQASPVTGDWLWGVVVGLGLRIDRPGVVAGNLGVSLR